MLSLIKNKKINVILRFVCYYIIIAGLGCLNISKAFKYILIFVLTFFITYLLDFNMGKSKNKF